MRSLSSSTQQAGLRQNNEIPKLGGGNMGASRVATGGAWDRTPQPPRAPSTQQAINTTQVSSNGSLGVVPKANSFGSYLNNWTAAYNTQAEHQRADARNTTEGSINARGLSDSASGADIAAKADTDLRAQQNADYSRTALEAYGNQAQLDLNAKIAEQENAYRQGTLGLQSRALDQSDPAMLARLEEEQFKKGLELTKRYGPKSGSESGSSYSDALNQAITNQAVGPGAPGGFSGVEDYDTFRERTAAKREAEANRKAENQKWASDLAASNRAPSLSGNQSISAAKQWALNKAGSGAQAPQASNAEHEANHASADFAAKNLAKSALPSYSSDKNSVRGWGY